MRVLTGTSAFGSGSPEAEQLLKEKGIELVKNPYGRKMTKDEIIKNLSGIDGLLAGLEPLDEDVFKVSPDLKVIARVGVGMDNVDRTAATKYGIKISNTPDAPTEAVVEMTIAALLSLSHNIVFSNMDIHNGEWQKRMGKSIKELSVLLIGYGNIGRRMHEVLVTFGTDVTVYDKYNPKYNKRDLRNILPEMDVVSLHASGDEEILTEELIGFIKDGAIILNSARGKQVSEIGIYNALKSGKVSAFWGDALWHEPYHGMVLQCDNAVLTPHISTYTSSCRADMELQAVKNLLKDLGL